MSEFNEETTLSQLLQWMKKHNGKIEFSYDTYSDATRVRIEGGDYKIIRLVSCSLQSQFRGELIHLEFLRGIREIDKVIQQEESNV